MSNHQFHSPPPNSSAANHSGCARLSHIGGARQRECATAMPGCGFSHSKVCLFVCLVGCSPLSHFLHRLYCSFIRFSIEWLHDGQHLAMSSNPPNVEFAANGTLMHIAAVQLDVDSGRYTCAAKNKVGKTEMDFFLEVIGQLIECCSSTFIPFHIHFVSMKNRRAFGFPPPN